MKTLTSRLQIHHTVAIAATACLLVFILSYSETNSVPKLLPAAPGQNSPEYYIEHSNSRLYGDQGQLSSSSQSEFIEHIPNTDNAQMHKPVINSYQNDQLHWVTRAQQGLIIDNGKRLDLQQQVIAQNQQGTTLKTTAISVYPDAKTLETDQKVTMSNEQGFTRSKGLQANLRNDEIILKNDVRGQFNVSPQ
jgi:lipopolysaccharide export system protein LptC